MKCLLVIHENGDTSALDSIAAESRLGVIEGWNGVESLVSCKQCDGGSLMLVCGIASLDDDRNVSGLISDKSDMIELADAVSNSEIDWVNFQAEVVGGDILVSLEGEGISRKIIPNPCTPGMPLAQVCASAKPAKKTASVLNKLIYRTAKSFPGRAIFVKKSGAPAKLPENFELLRLGKAGENSYSAIKDSEIAVVIVPKGGTASVLIRGGGIMGSGAKKFSDAACSRGFCMPADSLLEWVTKAAASRFK